MSIDSYFPPLPPHIKFRDNLRLNTNKLDGFKAIKSAVVGRKKRMCFFAPRGRITLIQ